MIYKIYVILLFIGLNISCNIKEKPDTGSQNKHKITVSFKIENSSVDITDNFQIQFSVNGKTKYAHVNGNDIILPNFLPTDRFVDVTFIFQEHELVFKDKEVQTLLQDQNMNWTFIKNSKSLQKSGLKNLDWDKVKELHHWQFNPLEKGEGIEIITPIY